MEEKFLTEEEKKKKQEENAEKEEKETTTTARQRRSSEKTAGGSKRLSKKEIEENEKKQRELEELEREAREKEEAERIAEEARLALEAEAAAKEKSEMEAQTGSILMKEYNIVDTGVNVEYLYSRDYEDLLKNKISIKKTNVNLENALPKVLTIPKRLDNFATSDIPPEILSYTRSEENRHIPIVLRNEDLFAISRQAVFENNLALLRSIIEKIQDPDFLVDNRYTLLSLSINNKRFDLVKFLVFNGANVNRRDLEGNSPLHSAILTRDRRIIDFLIKNGAELDLQNANGETPLMLATKTSQADLAIYIIRLGADLAIKNNDGLNILDIANKTKNRNLAKIIGDVMRSTDK
ncbi:MAG: ankyrin repeat domain-containing protein [Rickettsiales bacterium]|jgi:hypothetical protein|nr:ankyrin repeat domain-containing protein [Rickettsiales bacterium]